MIANKHFEPLYVFVQNTNVIFKSTSKCYELICPGFITNNNKPTLFIQ